jgi:hypothetical protein
MNNLSISFPERSVSSTDCVPKTISAWDGLGAGFLTV